MAVQRAIEERLAKGDFYDAQQMVKTAHRRMCAKSQYARAADECVSWAKQFCGVQQYELAVDLASDLVESFEASKAAPSEENLARVEAIYELLPPKVAVVSKYRVLHKAIAWSGQGGIGHPRLHRLAARSYWAEEDFGKSQAHMVYCEDGPLLATLVRDWRQRGYPNEKDLFTLRVLMILLSLNDLSTASSFWREMASQDNCEAAAFFEASDPAPPPPLQCGAFLLAAAEEKSLEFFRAVRGKYALVLRRDPTFDAYLNEAELKVFGVRSQPGGLGDLFNALLGGAMSS